ncbi:uncharacterized protein LOC117103782 [Anneissia japonica]|uniref:uncharacterized protein LOC117103782 n=1 Tax=Anneissia japonica TaxID=1529436 RepID=UPI001425B958|nr:uncharacterized protein LOC117103782 [Anneissia japonica]
MNASAPSYQLFEEREGETARGRRFKSKSSSTSKIREFTSSSSVPRGASRKKEKMAVTSLEPTYWSSQEFDVSVCIYCMKQGTSLTKIKAQGTKSIRTYFLDKENSCIRWKPTRKGTKAKIAVDCIKEVREGQKTDSFKRGLVNENIDSSCCFSIIYGNGLETVDLVANTKQEAHIWIQGMRFLLAGLQMEDVLVKSNRLRDNWLRTTFETADKSKNGLLDMDEVIRLLHKLNFKLSRRKVRKLFKEADTNTSGKHEGQLDYEEFMQFYKLISTRKELLFLLQQYSESKQFMTAKELQKFLQVEQKLEAVTVEMCEDIIETFEPVPENIQNKWLGIDGFTKYLLSPEGNVFNQHHSKVHQDMTRPLSHYYMAASHNTYLIGDQLMSQSSVDIYACVLQSGCRCVERKLIELCIGYSKYHDNDSIIKEDLENMFLTYFILSHEQSNFFFPDKLHTTPLTEHQTKLPSPEDLKEKILIKTKKLPMAVECEAETGEVTDEDSADEMEDNFKLENANHSQQLENIAMAQLALMQKKPISPGRKAWQVLSSKVKGQLVGQKQEDEEERLDSPSKSRNKAPQRTKKKKRSIRTFSSTDSGIGSEKSKDDAQVSGNTFRDGMDSRSRNGSKKKIVLSKKLSDLVVYTKSSSFAGFKPAPFWELPSMGEMRAMNLCTVHASQVVQFTCNNLCRVYPSAYRIDSSNYNPTPMWNAGIQIVALNYQTEGRAMQQCKAKFSYNGQCGYVLKPDYLCDTETVFDPNCQGALPNLQKKLLTLQVISGQQLPKPPQSLLGERGEIIDPFVEVEVIGLPVDTAKMATKTIQDNGFSPIWNSTMQFGIQAMDLALIRFAVWDEDPIGRDFIGQATLPLSSLTSGYRHIHLDGLEQATIFVHISITDFDEMLLIPMKFAVPKMKSIKHLKKIPTNQYSRSKSADDSGVQIQTTVNRKPSIGRMFSSRRRHTITTLFNRPKPQSGTFEDSQDDDLCSKEAKVLEVMLDSEDETAVCNSIILEQIITSNLSTRLEEDGSVSIAISQIPFLFKTLSVSTLLTCIREGTLNIRNNDSNRGSTCRLLYQYEPLQRPMDLPISETDEGSIRSWWNNLLQDMSEQYRKNSIASSLMQSIDGINSSTSSESSDEISFLSDLSNTYIEDSEVTSSEGIEFIQGSEGSSECHCDYLATSQSFDSLDNIQNPKCIWLSKSEDVLSTNHSTWQNLTFSDSDYYSATNGRMESDQEPPISSTVVQELSYKYKILQAQVKNTNTHSNHSSQNIDLKLERESEMMCDMMPDLLLNEKDGPSQQCDDIISCISIPCNDDGEFDTLHSRKKEKSKVRNDVMSLECDDVISDISCSDCESESASSDTSVNLNISDTSIPSVTFSEGAITGDLNFEGHYNLSTPSSTNMSSHSIPEYMLQRFTAQDLPIKKQKNFCYRNPYLNRLPKNRRGRSMSSATSDILCNTNQTCIKLLTPPPVKLRRSLSDRIITSSKVPFSSSVSSTLCEELMMTSDQKTQKEVLQLSSNFIKLNSNNSNNNDGCDGSDENSSDKDENCLSDNIDDSAQTSNSAISSNAEAVVALSVKPHTEQNTKAEIFTAMMPVISIDVTKDDPLWQSSDDEQDTSDSSSSNSSDNTILHITFEEIGKKSEAMGSPVDANSIEIGELKIKDIFDPEEYNYYKKCFLNRLHQAKKKRIHDARREGKKTSRNKMKRKELEKSKIKLNKGKQTDECNNVPDSFLHYSMQSDSQGDINDDKSQNKTKSLFVESDNCLLLSKRSDAMHQPSATMSHKFPESEKQLVNNYKRSTQKKCQDEHAPVCSRASSKHAQNTERHELNSQQNNDQAESSSSSKRAVVNHNPDTDYIQLHQMPDLLSNHKVEEVSQPIYENSIGSNRAGIVDESIIQPEQAPSVPFQLDQFLQQTESSRSDIDYGDYVTLRFDSNGHRLPLAEVNTSVKDKETGQGWFEIETPKQSENIYEELHDTKGRKLQRAQSMMLTRSKAYRPRPIDFTLEKMFIDSLNLEPGMMHDISLEDPRIINVNKTLLSSTMESKPIVASDHHETALANSEFETDMNLEDTNVLNLRKRSKQIIDLMANVTSPLEKIPVKEEHSQFHLSDTRDFRNKCLEVDLGHSTTNKGAGSRCPILIPEEDWSRSADYTRGTQLFRNKQKSVPAKTDAMRHQNPVQSDDFDDDKQSAAKLRLSDAWLRNHSKIFHSGNWHLSTEHQHTINSQQCINKEQQHVTNDRYERQHLNKFQQMRMQQRVSSDNQHESHIHECVNDDNLAFSKSTNHHTPILTHREDHPALTSDGRGNTKTTYIYDYQRLNESEGALMEYKPLRTNKDYVVFPQNRRYFRGATNNDNLFQHNYGNHRIIDRKSDNGLRPIFDNLKAKDKFVDSNSNVMFHSLSTVNCPGRKILNTTSKTGARRAEVESYVNPIMVDQATSPGIARHSHNAKYTKSTQPSMQQNDTHGPLDVSNESCRNSNLELCLTSTPTRSTSGRVMSENRQWDISGIRPNCGKANGSDDALFSFLSQMQTYNNLHVKYRESTSPIYENMNSLNQRSKQDNYSDSTVIEQVKFSGDESQSRIASTSLTVGCDQSISPSTILTQDVPPEKRGIKRWFTNDNVAVHKMILRRNDESETSLNVSTPKPPPDYDEHINNTRSLPGGMKLASSVEFLPNYEDHLHKHGMEKHYSSTPSLFEDDDSVFLDDSEYDEETPPRPRFLRNTSQPEKARSSIIRNRSSSVSGIKRTKSVRFEVPGGANTQSPPSMNSDDQIPSSNGESFSIIERLVGKQSYKEILEKWAQKNLLNEEERNCSIPDEETISKEGLINQSKADLTEDVVGQFCQRASLLQPAIYALPNITYNEYTEMADGVQIKEYGDVGTIEMTPKTHSEISISAQPASLQVDTGLHAQTRAKHCNEIDKLQSWGSIPPLSRYQMNYRGMETSDFWTPIGSDENTRHHSSSSSNMSIPSSTTDITYLTEFDRNDTRRGVIRRDVIPIYNTVNSQRGIKRSSPVMVEPPFDVVSPDNMFKWANYSPRSDDDPLQMSPEFRQTARPYSAGNFNTKFTVAKRRARPIRQQAKDNGRQVNTTDTFKARESDDQNKLDDDKRHTRGGNVLFKYKGSLQIRNLKNGLKNVFKKKGSKHSDDSSEHGSESSDKNHSLSTNNQELNLTLKDHIVVGESEHRNDTPHFSRYGSKSGNERASLFSLKSDPEPLQNRHRSLSMPFVSSLEMLDVPSSQKQTPHVYFSLNV